MVMDPVRWARDFADDFSSSPGAALVEAGFRGYLGLWHSFTSRHPLGTNIYERDWDVLIVLDACRVDALRAVASEYAFLNDVGAVWSVGSGSHEWLARTFVEDYRNDIENTTFTTPNGFGEILFLRGEHPPRHPTPIEFPSNEATVSNDGFDLLDLTWNFSPNPELGITPPRFMTDRAIHLGRSREPERLIIQYYQPHVPYIGRAIQDGAELEVIDTDPWDELRSGRTKKNNVWEHYLDNLRLVLNEIELLLNNLNANRVAITADHGEAFGELGAYGHPEGFPHPATRRVPWATTTATDSETHNPHPNHTKYIGRNPPAPEADTIKERLEKLGYA